MASIHDRLEDSTQENDQLAIALHLRQERIAFIGILAAWITGLVGSALIIIFLANLLTIFQTGLGDTSWVQLMQGLLGALLLGSALKGSIAKLVSTIDTAKSGKLRIFLIPLLIWPIFLIYRVQLSDFKSYIRRISEGSLVEWLGFVLFLGSSFLLFKVASEVRGSLVKFLTRVGGLGLFLLAMEEMSWGQMIFNWNSPAIMDQHNMQQETNLHNLSFLHYHTWTIAASVFSLLLIAALVGFLLRRNGRLRLGSVADLLLPIGCTASYFAIAAVMYWGVVLEKQGIDLIYFHTREQEIAEFLFAAGVFIHVVYLFLDLPISSLRAKQSSPQQTV